MIVGDHDLDDAFLALVCFELDGGSAWEIWELEEFFLGAPLEELNDL